MQQTVTSWCHLCHIHPTRFRVTKHRGQDQVNHNIFSEISPKIILKLIWSIFIKLLFIKFAHWTINPFDIQIECLQIRHNF